MKDQHEKLIKLKEHSRKLTLMIKEKKRVAHHGDAGRRLDHTMVVAADPEAKNYTMEELEELERKLKGAEDLKVNSKKMLREKMDK